MYPSNYTQADMERMQEQQRVAMQESLRHSAAIALLTALAIRSDESDEQIAKRAVRLSYLFANELFKSDV